MFIQITFCLKEQILKFIILLGTPQLSQLFQENNGILLQTKLLPAPIPPL
jgi:hypothetical protein